MSISDFFQDLNGEVKVNCKPSASRTAASRHSQNLSFGYLYELIMPTSSLTTLPGSYVERCEFPKLIE